MGMKFKAALVVLTSGVLTAIASVYTYYHSQAAVRVRPELANVGYFDAMMTGHGGDWLFYHEPVLGVIMIFVIMLIAVSLSFLPGSST